MSSWDMKWMDLAEHIAGWSKDRSTKLGCVIVGEDNEIRSIGYNGFPRKLNDDLDSRHERPAKYAYTEHAERNAIYNAARVGVPLKGCKMYIPWYPCCDCARGIVQSGISEIVVNTPDYNDERWGEQFKVSTQILQEGGVIVRYYDNNND